MKAMFEKEFKGYFHTVTGWLFCAFLLLFAGIYTMALCLGGGYAQFEYVLGNMSFVFVIVIPILTMRVLAEERRQKTDQLLYSLPLGLGRVVLGKYLALLAVLAVPTAVLGLYPLVLGQFGAMNYKGVYASLLCFFLLGAALLAVGMYLSSVTENLVAAAALCFVAVLVNYYLSALSSYVPTTASGTLLVCMLAVAVVALLVYWLTKNSIAFAGTLAAGAVAVAGAWYLAQDNFENLLPALLKKLSLFEAFYSCLDGVLDLANVFFLLSVTGVFLLLTVQSLEKRRWSA